MGVDHGIIAPGFQHTDQPVQVAMVQTLVRRLHKMPAIDLLVVDECHHAVAGSWEKITRLCKTARILGVTATPQRLDGRGLKDAFDELVIGPNPRELIERGALAPYVYLAPNSGLDLSGVTTRGGDWDAEELEDIIQSSPVVGDCIEYYRKHLDGRPALVFCATVRGAEAIAARFTAAGIPAASVDGEMGRAERAERLAGLEDGSIKVITSCELISEGFDVPAVAGAILLRPTQSLSLFLQQVGRALRPKEDGGCAFILDHVGNVYLHGMPDMKREWTLEGGKKKSDPVTTCDLCYRVQPLKEVQAKGFICPVGLGVRTPPTDQDELDQLLNDLAEMAIALGYDPDTQRCPYLEPKEEKPTREGPEEIDGELVEVTDIRPRNYPEWADGLSLLARGRQWFELLDRAGTDTSRLQEIADARGFKRGWIKHQLAARYEIDRKVQAVIDGQLGIAQASESVLWALIRTVEQSGDSDKGRAVIRSLRAEINSRKARAA